MQFHPVTKELWFTDNNRDSFGDDKPDGKLNRVSYPGEDFGFPYCHTGGIIHYLFHVTFESFYHCLFVKKVLVIHI